MTPLHTSPSSHLAYAHTVDLIDLAGSGCGRSRHLDAKGIGSRFHGWVSRMYDCRVSAELGNSSDEVYEGARWIMAWLVPYQAFLG